MTRWFFVVAITVLVGFTLRPMFSGRFEIPEDTEETRMFVVSENQTVRFAIPARTRFVELQVVAHVRATTAYDPRTEYPYAFEAVLLDVSGNEIFKWDAEATSRVSLERFPALPADQRGARLVGSRDWLTDNRSITLPVESLLRKRNGFLFLRAKSDRTVYVRGFGVRGERIRLTVAGARGRDYDLRRVILSKYRRVPTPPADVATQPPIHLLAGRTLALNVSGAIDLWIAAERSCPVHVTDGIHQRSQATELPLKLGKDVEAFISLADLGPRTLAVRSEGDCLFRLFTNEAGSTRMIGTHAFPAASGRWLVEPDRRQSEWFSLDENVPLTNRVEKGQPTAHVVFRRIAQAVSPDGKARVQARYEVVRSNGKREVRHVDVPRPWSRYESVDGRAVSAAHVVVVRFPPDAVSLEVFGDHDTLGRVSVESGLEEQIAPPYERTLPRGRNWYGVPKLRRAWLSTEADNYHDLVLKGRLRVLAYQPRIVGEGGRPERDDGIVRRFAPNSLVAHDQWVPSVLEPYLTPFSHRVFLRQKPGERGAPHEAWTRVPQGGVSVRVRPQSGGWLNVTWRLPSVALGREVGIAVDGVAISTLRATTPTEQTRVRVSPGVHRIVLSGLPPEANAFVDAMPTEAATIMLSRRATEIAHGESLTYRVPVEQDDEVLVVLQVFTEKPGETWVLPYNVFVNEGDTREARFLDSGSLQGSGTRERTPILWDVGNGTNAGFDDDRIPLRRPDAPTMRTIKVRLAGGTAPRVWVRAVLMGKPTKAHPETFSVGRGGDL